MITITVIDVFNTYNIITFRWAIITITKSNSFHIINQ